MTTTTDLGRLEKVDLRDVWENEAGDFTPWLAQEENISLLGDTIGIDLEVEAQEKNVGPFRADILCKDTANDQWVLIENQLERTDRSHLGQLITYAAGLNAVTIVWIANRFTDEHRAALDWLNEMTAKDISFFGLEVELWRIANSPVAPKFNLVSSPNDWTKGGGRGGEKLTEGRQLQLDFWIAFREFVRERGSMLKPQKPAPQTWMTLAIGRSGFHLAAIASLWDSVAQSYDSNELRTEIVLVDANSKTYFAQLESQKEQIEAELGGGLVWYNPQDKRQSKVYVKRSALLKVKDNWPEYHKWLLKNLEAFHRVFHPLVKRLKVDDAELAEIEE